MVLHDLDHDDDLIFLLQSTTSSSNNEKPSDVIRGRVALDTMFTILVFLVITANVYFVLKLKVYKNFNSMSIMISITIIQLLRLCTYIIRLVTDKFSEDMWAWYRITTDISNYLLGVVAIVLLVQWQQTYQVLHNPLRAIQTMEKNWAQVTQIVVIAIYTMFMIFDIGVVIDDASRFGSEEEKTAFIESAYTLLMWV